MVGFMRVGYDYFFFLSHGLSTACASYRNYVVCLEAIDHTTVFVNLCEPLDESLVVKVGGDVGELVPACPNVVTGEQEVIGQHGSVRAVEEFVIVEADIVEADVLRVRSETDTALLVESVTVKVVVDGVVVDHLRH